MRSPISGLANLEECANCRLMVRADRFEIKNPNVAYEEGEEAVERLLSQEKRRGPYYDTWVDRIEKIIPPPGPLLEIGVGAGGLMGRLIGRGWTVEGIESSPLLASTAQEAVGDTAKVHAVRLEEAADRLTLSPYQGIVAIDILEHLPDLTLLPKLAWNWLRPNGVLILQTPNALALRRFIQKEHWEQLAPTEHFVIHSKMSLRLVLERSGYYDVGIDTASGTATDGFVRRTAMAATGPLLNYLGAGAALVAVGRKKAQ